MLEVMEPKEPKYGLFKFNKNIAQSNTKVLAKPSIFADDSDSDTESTVPTHQSNTNLKRQIKNKLEKAIEIDATIFQYDEVYDQIKSSNRSEQIQTNVERKPKYISNLLKAAEGRKREQEIRLERKIQKERENEGDEFKDKESFVTSSYREKLEERRKTNEELEKQDRIDNMLDVTKQNDLTGFYQNFYKKSMFNENNETEEKEKIVFNKSNVRKKITLRERDIVDVDNNDDDDNNNNDTDKAETDAPNSPVPEEKLETVNQEPKEPESKDDQKFEAEISITISAQVEEKSTKQEESVEKVQEKKLTRAELIAKLFTKRTVGTVFDEARKRYLERKQLMGQ